MLTRKLLREYFLESCILHTSVILDQMNAFAVDSFSIKDCGKHLKI